MSNLNRRDFLKLAGKTMLGAAAVTAVPAVVSAETEISAPAFPWTWPGLDVKEVQDKVYANFFTKGGCCAAVASGILDLLAEKYGYPYNQIDGRMFAHGGGGYGRQNLCGSLGGAFAIAGLFAGSGANAIRNEIYSWYDTTAFPLYQPADAPVHPVHTVSGSELCKVSVGTWMTASGCEFGSQERKVRCASLSADVAGKLVEILNIQNGITVAPVVTREPVIDADGAVHGFSKTGRGDVEVRVFMDGDKITNIEVVSTKETPGFRDKAIAEVPGALVASNGDASVINLDAYAGASETPKALIAAVQDALASIGK